MSFQFSPSWSSPTPAALSTGVSLPPPVNRLLCLVSVAMNHMLSAFTSISFLLHHLGLADVSVSCDSYFSI